MNFFPLFFVIARLVPIYDCVNVALFCVFFSSFKFLFINIYSFKADFVVTKRCFVFMSKYQILLHLLTIRHYVVVCWFYFYFY